MPEAPLRGLMLLIYITLIAMLAMARKPRKKRPMGRYIRGNIDADTALGTLAAQTGIRTALAAVVTERTLVSSIVCTYGLQGFTVTDNVGPVVCGVSHSDYSLVEIEQWIEQTTGAWAEADLVAQEISKRKIRRIGTFAPPLSLATVSLNDGKPIKTKLNWILNSGQTLAFWVYNQGSVAIGGTDPDFHATGHANLWPR